MKVVTRLYLAVVPAVLGVLVVAALAYWGERGRQAPAMVIVIAVVASVVSLIAAWRNTRYVARRVTQLAQGRTPPDVSLKPTTRDSTADELDAIEATVQDLSSEVTQQRLAGERRARSAEERAAEYAELLDGAVATMGASLEQARLPLHILLSSPFGELNENQEEMLDAAQRAVDAADADLTRLRKLIDIDRGVVRLSPQPVAVAELLRAPIAIAKSRAVASVVQLVADIPDSLPRAIVDPLHSQDALTALLADVVSRTPAGGEVSIRAHDAGSGRLILTVKPNSPMDRLPLDVRLAQRILEREGGASTDTDGARRIELRGEHA
jgi:signal transduction histidine kinase